MVHVFAAISFGIQMPDSWAQERSFSSVRLEEPVELAETSPEPAETSPELPPVVLVYFEIK